MRVKVTGKFGDPGQILLAQWWLNIFLHILAQSTNNIVFIRIIPAY